MQASKKLCRDCDYRFDTIFSDEECPNCGSEDLILEGNYELD